MYICRADGSGPMTLFTIHCSLFTKKYLLNTMKQTKHILHPLLMAIVMLVGMLVPQGAWAENEDVTIDGITFSYDVEGDGITISYCESGEAIYVEVPAKINGTPVTKIGDNAFSGKKNLRVVVLPASITTLGESIFRGTDNLLAIEFKGEYPPADINESAFYAFNKSNLSIVVPEGRVEAYQEALGERLAPGKFVTKMPDLPIFLDDIEYRITDADSKYVSLYSAREVRGDITIPATISDDKGVEYTVTEVAGSAFDSNRDLTSVTIPGTVETIRNAAFVDCYNLATVTLSEGVHALGTHAFCNTALTFIVLPASLTSVGVDAFSECNNLGYMVFMGNKPKLHTQGFLYNRTAPITLYVKDLSQWNTTDKLGAKDECEVTYKSLSDYCSDVHGGHDFTSQTLTAEPDDHGLYAYVCDREECGEHGDYNVVKAGDGEGATTIELTATTVGETTTYTAETPVTLTDAGGFASPVPFTAASITYERSLASGKWGTLCLPYALSAKDGYEYFQLSDVSNDAVTLSKIEGTVAAGTPVLVRHSDSGNLSLTETDVLVGISTNPAGAIQGLQLQGTFVPTPVTSGYYLDATDGKLHSIDEWSETNGALTIPAFRAWFASSTPSGARSLGMIIDDDEAASLDALRAALDGTALIYGLDGQLRSELRKGVNVVNGKKVIVK